MLPSRLGGYRTKETSVAVITDVYWACARLWNW